MKFSVPSLIVPKAKLNREAIKDGIDTGVVDGSGGLTVRAGAARKSGENVAFQNVEIVADSLVSGSKGYANWSQDSLKAEAIEMLRRDYCH
jgi:hypothetical protein